MTPTLAEGGCQCGAVRYRLSGKPEWLTICHCYECKKQSGGAFGMSLRMREADVAVLSGHLERWARPSDDGGTVECCFCGICGTRIWHARQSSDFIHIKPGTLDDPSRFRPRYGAFTKHKAAWLTIEGLDMSFEGQPSSPPPKSG